MDNTDKNNEFTMDSFPAAKISTEELKVKYGAEENKKLLSDEVDFSNEVQLFVMNQLKKRKLTVNFAVGTLFKLAWEMMNDDFHRQMVMSQLYKMGGK